MNEQDILKRLKELEKENQNLRKAVEGAAKPKETTTHVGMYKGHPIITFEGNFRPFSLGVRKASIVLERVADLEHFVKNNQKFNKPDEDEKIGQVI